MENQNVQTFKLGDVVEYNNNPYKVIHVYPDGNLKIRRIKGKTNEVIYHVPFYFVNIILNSQHEDSIKSI